MEYGLLVAAVAGMIAVVAFTLGNLLNAGFVHTAGCIENQAAPSAPCLIEQARP